MGTSPRSWWSRRVTSLAAATFGVALTAAFVARRRAAPPPTRPPTRSATPGSEDRPELDRRPLPRPGGRSEEQPAGTSNEARDVASPAPVAVPDDVVPPLDGRRRIRAVAGWLALAVALSVGLASIVLGRDDDQPGAAGVDTTATTSGEATTTTTTAIDDMAPHDAFAHAADRLVSGGAFGYVGTTRAIDVSHARPGLWLAVDLTVDGQVVTSAERVHEIAVDGSGRAVETVMEGPVVWSRLATSPASLAGASYLPITEESGVEGGGKGVALLPTWLDSTVDRRDAGTDESGQRVLRATLPAGVLGEIVDGRQAGEADVMLTLDAAGDPVHVEVTSVSLGTPLRLALDIIEIGKPILIELPAQ